MADDLSTIARTVQRFPDRASATATQHRNVFLTPPRRHALVPKFKVWHQTELEAAVKVGTVFFTRDQYGRQVTFTLAAPITAGERLKVERIDQNASDAAASEHTISTDDIVHAVGPWPHYLTLRAKRSKSP